MSSHNPIHEEPIQETPSNKTTPEPQIPEASLENSQESKKSKPDEKPPHEETVEEEISGGREKLKRHRVEVAGRVWIPDMWGQEELLKDWIDCAAFDAALVSSSILMARDSLMEERRRANSTGVRILN